MSEKKPENPVKKPKKVGSLRANRGGYWDSLWVTDIDHGNANFPSGPVFHVGFRLARTKK